ncbi:MAG: ABC transporter permease [Armatimonadota bacterium]|nr:ABC transporter permease [Armatimonadota bacterium]MDR7452067.1 ABC transporter permease [Armatimonadota bacterium]MDR7466529.1 ABC transporter permease [Armatimonadota bacterium]MDR7493251.1 ABC transporter permease [Armatimonadota bacterium]MDR7499856.1 ABC transporter permease [Armatimonadota bacterium]
MSRYVGRRLLQSLVVLAGLSVLLFTLLVYTPGDPVEIIAATQPDLEPEDIRRLREYYGLDDPVGVRYVKWLRTVVKGDLGISRTYGQPVTRLIRQRLGNTLQLLTAAFLIAFTLGVSVGLYSALHQYSVVDYLATLLSFAGLAMPVFWLGILVILVFAVWLPVFPAGGMMTPGVEPGWPTVVDRLRHLVLPTLVLAAAGMATWVRYSRSAMLEVVRQDYIRTARSKGLPETLVTRRHALRNALIPIVTLLALSIPAVLDGAVVTETIFSWPGMGLLLFQAVLGHDHAVAMAVLMFLAVATLLANLVADVAYALVDPRIRYE